MSEKRFRLEISSFSSKHIKFLNILDNGKRLKSEDIVDLLNEQDKEIGLLRLELETQKHPLWSTREAERRVNKLTDSLVDEVKKNGLLSEELNQLRIENMRLKEEIEIIRKELENE